MIMLVTKPAFWKAQGRDKITVPVIVFQILNIITVELFLLPGAALVKGSW